MCMTASSAANAVRSQPRVARAQHRGARAGKDGGADDTKAMRAEGEARAFGGVQCDMLLTVIVPVYNVLPYLDRCVESLLGQRYGRLEILLVDDGSTDGSGDACDAWARRDERIRVIHQRNGGLSAARNAGLDACTGEWIAFVDSDDWVAPEMFCELIALCIEHDAQIGACAFNYVFAGREQAAGATGAITVLTRNQALGLLHAQRETRFEACARVYRRGVIGENRFQVGQIFEDIRFTRLTFWQMERYVYLDRPLYQYLQNRAGNTNSSFPAAKLQIVAECDAFATELAAGGLPAAAQGMEAFTLEHLIRMDANARACRAGHGMLRRILRDYRQRMIRALRERNPCVRKARGLLFFLSPRLYGCVSRLLRRGRNRVSG